MCHVSVECSTPDLLYRRRWDWVGLGAAAAHPDKYQALVKLCFFRTMGTNGGRSPFVNWWNNKLWRTCPCSFLFYGNPPTIIVWNHRAKINAKATGFHRMTGQKTTKWNTPLNQHSFGAHDPRTKGQIRKQKTLQLFLILNWYKCWYKLVLLLNGYIFQLVLMLIWY